MIFDLRHSRVRACLLAASLAGAATPPLEGAEKADLVLRNGTIVTVDPAKPKAEALAVRGGTILAVGTNTEIQSFVAETTQVIDLAGRLAVPGFVEGHGHFLGIGQAKMGLELMIVRN